MESRKMDNREIIEYYLNELKKMRDEWKAEEGKENEKTIRGYIGTGSLCPILLGVWLVQ